MKSITYAYCRVSTPKQKLERQKKNILTKYPDAVIFSEKYTGTTLERPAWKKLQDQAEKDAASGKKVTIVFDSVSRMSRDADEGYTLYEELFEKGIELEFINEPYLNTEVYKNACKISIKTGEEVVDDLLKSLEVFINKLSKKQIKIGFDQAEKEVQDLRKRTSQGMLAAKANGSQIGRVKGKKYVTKKEKEAKEIIKKKSRDFEGTNNDKEVMLLAGISRNTFYKYKRELLNK